MKNLQRAYVELTLRTYDEIMKNLRTYEDITENIQRTYIYIYLHFALLDLAKFLFFICFQ